MIKSKKNVNIDSRKVDNTQYFIVVRPLTRPMSTFSFIDDDSSYLITIDQ